MSETATCGKGHQFVRPTGSSYPCPVCSGETSMLAHHARVEAESMPDITVMEANEEILAMRLETGCCVCGGTLVPMGQLGRRTWFRCRDCGAEESMLDD